MIVNFLGTGTSMGVPVAGNFGGEHITDPRDFRYRCSVWIRVKGLSILIDAGPEFRLQSIRAGITDIDLMLLTHEHTDHVCGIDDLRPYNYHQQGGIKTFASQNCIASLKRRFYYMFPPEKTPGSVDLDFLSTSDVQHILGDIQFEVLPVMHGSMEVYGFRIGDFSYVTDAKVIPQSTKDKIRGSKVLVLNGLRWEPHHFTHITIPEAVEIATELEIPKTYLVHMNSFVNHGETEKRLPSHVRLAYDTLEIDV